MEPLVTVGIPTYNRPEGLRRALQLLTNQTYRNLEIIVADNNSENENVRAIIEEFAKKDPRIIYHRHPANIGAYRNFQYVLEKASGVYFMWAADDDEWREKFVEELLGVIGNRSAAFCNYAVKYKETNTLEHIIIPAKPPGMTKYEEAKDFLEARMPSIFYGLYRTEDVKWVAFADRIFDWFDCYVILKIILLYKGFAFSENELYTAGIPIGSSYQYKPVNPSKNRVFSYTVYFKRSANVVLQSDLPYLEKMKLLNTLVRINFKTFLVIEKNRKSYRFYSLLYRVYKLVTPSV